MVACRVGRLKNRIPRPGSTGLARRGPLLIRHDGIIAWLETFGQLEAMMPYTLALKDAIAQIESATGEQLRADKIAQQLGKRTSIERRFNDILPAAENLDLFDVPDVPGLQAAKINGRWRVDPEQLKALMPSLIERANRERERVVAANVAMEQAAFDYVNHVLHPGRNQISKSRYYGNHGEFHTLVVSYFDSGRTETYQTWICNNCWNRADLENNKPECHRCSDWSPCGNDCTLSAVYCSNCGTRLTFWTPEPA